MGQAVRVGPAAAKMVNFAFTTFVVCVRADRIKPEFLESCGLLYWPRDRHVPRLKRGIHMNLVRNIFRDEAGVSAIEYGLLVAIMAIGLNATLQGLGSRLDSTFDSTSSSIANAV